MTGREEGFAPAVFIGELIARGQAPLPDLLSPPILKMRGTDYDGKPSQENQKLPACYAGHTEVSQGRLIPGSLAD